MARETRLALAPLLHRCSSSIISNSATRSLPAYLLPSLFQAPLHRRNISSTPGKSQPPPPSSSSAAATAVENESQPSPSAENNSPPTPQQRSSRREVDSQGLDDFSFMRRQASSAREEGDEKNKRSWTALDQLLRNAANPSERRPLQPSAGGARGRLDIGRMQFPGSASESDGLLGGGGNDKLNYQSLFPSRRSHLAPNTTATDAEMAAPPFKVSPSLGRTVQVDAMRGMDVARAFKTVDMKCAQNAVKQDLFRQRFHERPGLKRKRLRRERWRYRFKTSFQATVRRVEALNRQGW